MEISCILYDDIILIMDMKKKTLKILKDSNEKELYSEINTEKPLFPIVFLKNQYDSVEITDYYQEYKTLMGEKDKNKSESKKEEPKLEKIMPKIEKPKIRKKSS